MNGYSAITAEMESVTMQAENACVEARKFNLWASVSDNSARRIELWEKESWAWSRYCHHLAILHGLRVARDLVFRADIEVSEAACKAD